MTQVSFAIENELAPVPVMAVAAVKVAEAPVELVKVITWVAALTPTVVDGNVKEDGVIVRPVLAAVPVPDNATSCGVPVALSAIDNEAGSDPTAVGLNSTEMVQLAEAARDVVQVVADFTYEDAPVPVNPIVPSVTAETLVFFTVTTCAAVVEPTVVEANVSDDGVIVRPVLALAPVPDRATVCGVEEAES